MFRGQNTWRPLSMLQKLEVNLLGWGFKILREILFLPFPDPRLCLGCSVGDIVSMDGLDVFHEKKTKISRAKKVNAKKISFLLRE